MNSVLWIESGKNGIRHLSRHTYAIANFIFERHGSEYLVVKNRLGSTGQILTKTQAQSLVNGF